jgi:hypothetical protein
MTINRYEIAMMKEAIDSLKFEGVEFITKEVV